MALFIPQGKLNSTMRAYNFLFFEFKLFLSFFLKITDQKQIEHTSTTARAVICYLGVIIKFVL